MLKFGFSEHVVVDAFTDSQAPKYDINSPDSKKCADQFGKTVQAAKRVIKKSGDFLYVRTRAIGSLEKWGPNMNGDGFPMNELTASYQTFVGKGNFIDHKSDDITMIRGLIVDAYLNQGDECVETLVAVDRKSHPQLARDIETGVVNSVSMGTRVGRSNCSVCGNEARTEKDYCSHIQNYKGMKIGFLTNNAAHKMGAYAVHEVNHDLEFIELSWVSVPAFKDAYVLEKIASLKTAVDNGLLNNNHTHTTDGRSDAENELLGFVASKNESIPSSLNSIAEAASCKSTECEFDARKRSNMNNKVQTKVAGEMNRIRVTREEVNYRTAPKDFGAKGNVSVDNKEYKWWGSSADKQTWHISLDESLMMFSANGQAQIVKAIQEMINKNIDNTELIVASTRSPLSKTGYLQGGEDALMNEELAKAVADGKNIYNNKDLAAPVGDVGEYEYKTYSQTAKDGAAGALGKSLAKNDETLKKDESDLKQELHRAYVSYKFKKKIGRK
jgi:phage head maturation protease